MYVYMAGAEKLYPDLIEFGAKNIFMTYYYLRNRNIDNIYEYKERFPGIRIMVDSGVFSLIGTIYGKGEVKDQSFYVEYKDRYFSFIEQHKDLFDVFVNFDLYDVVSYEDILRWNDDIPVKDKICFCWHHQYGEGSLEHYAETYPYISVTTVRGSRSFPYIRNIFNRVRKKNPKIKIHGLGMTEPKMLFTVPFYSVDSTSWLTGKQFGVTFDLNGRHMYRHAHYKKWLRKGLKKRAERHNVPNIQGFVEDSDPKAVDLWSVSQWMRLQDALDKKWEGRFYYE